jgi:hypothetical protein
MYTNYQPLEKLRQVQAKMLNHLQEAMLQFHFQISYKKGSKMPADYLSHNVVDTLSLQPEKLWQE